MPKRYWLMKCEPAAYTIDDLARDGRTSWEGCAIIRRATSCVTRCRRATESCSTRRTLIRLASPASHDRPGRIPGRFALKKGHKYYDEASTKAAPIWYRSTSVSMNASRRSFRSRH